MFKGFLAFAMWGYLLMCSIDGDEENIGAGSRNDYRKGKIERSAVDRDLDKRGSREKDDDGDTYLVDNQFTDLLHKGRLETQRQKAFHSRVGQL